MIQNLAMAALGYFVFMRSTVPYQSMTRDLSWSHPTNDVVGSLPKTQFTGKAGETLELSGELRPEVSGGKMSLLALEMMAETGEAYPLIDGATFLVLGWFKITKIHVTSTVFFGDGTPRAISFSMGLQRVDDSILTSLSDDIASFI